MSRYERIRVLYGGMRQTWLTKIVEEGEDTLLLQKVRRDGSGFSRERADGIYIETIHLIQKQLISKRTPMRINWHYGELEPDPNA